MSKIFGFLNDGLSINEAKVSLIALLLTIISITGFIMIFKNGDITSNYRDVWLGFGALFVGNSGINVIKQIKEKINNI